jgi:drug/metabolite transporter (DMT)-like permease
LAILLHGDPARLTSFDLNHGDLVMLLGTLFWAAYTTLLRLRPAIFSTTSFAAITYSVAGLINLPRAG